MLRPRCSKGYTVTESTDKDKKDSAHHYRELRKLVLSAMAYALGGNM